MTGIVSSIQHMKQLPTVQSSYLEENAVGKLLSTEHTSDILERQLAKWAMYGETMRVWSIARPYLKPSYINAAISYRSTMLKVWYHKDTSTYNTWPMNGISLIFWQRTGPIEAVFLNWYNLSFVILETQQNCSLMTLWS